MLRPLRCRIDRRGDGGWRVSVDDGDTRAAWGDLAAAEVAAIYRACAAATESSAAVYIRGHDARQSALEEDAGRALARIFSASSQVATRFERHRAEARAAGSRLRIVVDAPGMDERRLPWETLAASDPAASMEGLGSAVMLRLAEGPPPASRGDAGTIRVLSWIPDDDPTLAAQADSLDRTLAASGLAPAERIHRLSAEIEPRHSRAVLLHVICHGSATVDAVQVQLPQGDTAAATITHALGLRLPFFAVVILDVCAGGAPVRNEIDGLVARLLAAGAPACIAPARETSAAASTAFAEGFYRSLAAGDALPDAIAAGRASVRALAHPHPDSRWHNYQATFGSLSEVRAGALVRRAWRPAGWPAPDPDCGAWLAAVRDVAGGTEASYLGVEHLAIALAATAGAGPATRRAKLALSAAAREMERDLARFQPTAVPPSTRPSPRIASLGERLREPVTIEQIWAALPVVGVGPLGLYATSPLGTGADASDPRATESSEHATVTAEPESARHLEVEGGPDDGRLLLLAAGDRIGRWDGADPPAPGAIYAHAAVEDPALSRTHAEWLGEGRIRALRRCVVLRSGTPRALDAGEEVLLRCGDVVQLGRGTRLVAR